MFELDAHIEAILQAKAQHHQLMNDVSACNFDVLLLSLDVSSQCAILRAEDGNLLSWLAVLPMHRDQFDLSAQEFYDGLALQYNKPPLCMPPTCDGCGAPFTVTHALDCHVGGLVGRIHNEVRDAFGDLASLVWGQVHRELVVNLRKSHNADDRGAVVADLCVRGVWQPQSNVLFDFWVVDTDAPSYSRLSPRSVLCSAEFEKKWKACHDCQLILLFFVCLWMICWDLKLNSFYDALVII